MTSPDHDARATTHLGHEVVVTGPGLDPRRRWALLGVGVLVFLVVVFALSRWGAEHGNEGRFAFPDQVDGLDLTKPDRAPEARDREITTHYDKRGDGRATVVVEWLPDTTPEEALQGTVGDETISCVQAEEIVCATTIKDGVLRVSQSSSAVREVRGFTRAFLDARETPDADS